METMAGASFAAAEGLSRSLRGPTARAISITSDVGSPSSTTELQRFPREAPLKKIDHCHASAPKVFFLRAFRGAGRDSARTGDSMGRIGDEIGQSAVDAAVLLPDSRAEAPRQTGFQLRIACGRRQGCCPEPGKRRTHVQTRSHHPRSEGFGTGS